MKKIGQPNRFTIIRVQNDKRTTTNQGFPALSKQDFGQDISNQYKQLSNSQTEIARKIQSKVRLRKITGSEKRLENNETQKISTQQNFYEKQNDLQEDFQSKVQFLLEKGQQIQKAIDKFKLFIQPAEIKLKLSKQLGIIRCFAINTSLEQVLINRVTKMGQLAKSEQTCHKHENHLQKMLQDRMNKLINISKSR